MNSVYLHLLHLFIKYNFEGIYNIKKKSLNVFTVTLEQLNASLKNKSIHVSNQPQISILE